MSGCVGGIECCGDCGVIVVCGGGVDVTVDGGELLDDEKFGKYGGGVKNGFVMRGTVKSMPRFGNIGGGAMKKAS